MVNNKYKIIIRGGYGLTNFGDDALLKSLHEDYFSLFSSSELAYSCAEADYLSKYIPGYDILPLNTEYNTKCNILVYGGGTQFYSFDKNNVKEKFVNNKALIKNPVALFQKIIKVCQRNLLLLNKKPITYKSIAVGIGVGPFLLGSDPKVEEGVCRLFQNMEFVGIRDVYSKKKCELWNVNNYKLYADLCFKMENSLFFKSSKAISINNLGIVVRDWKRTKEGSGYRDSLMKFINRVCKENVLITFFVFAKNSDPEWIDFLNLKKIKFVLWNPDTDSFDSYLKQLSYMDAFVTARYHGAIFSSMLGKPFITIEVEQKLKMYSQLFQNGSNNWSFPFSEIDLYNKFSQINQNYNQFSSTVLEEAKNQKKMAENMADDLSLFLKSNL